MPSIDLHVHTSRYSSCSRLQPERLGLLADSLPVEAIVITEHDAIWPREELQQLQDRIGANLRLFRAVEVSTSEGHVLAYHLQDDRPLTPGMPLDELVRMAREDEAALVLAHPGRFIQSVPEGRGTCWDYLSAVEVMSNNITEPMIAQVRQAVAALEKPVVAGSDAHVAEIVGLYATSFPHMPADEAELARMIIDGSGVPWADVERIDSMRHMKPEKQILVVNPVETQEFQF